MNPKSWACVALALAACRAPKEDVAYDLAALVSEARVIGEIELLDFGVPDARSHLEDGWSRDESSTDGTSFVWSTGEVSALRLFLAELRDVQVSFRCWTFPYPEAPPQELSVELNGVAIRNVQLAAGPAEYQVVLPSGVLQSGNNRLAFRHAWHRAPRDVIEGAVDGRSLAVGWDWLRIDNALLAGRPDAEGATLTLPPFARVEYLLELPTGSVLRVDRIDGTGSSLNVTVETLHGKRTETAAIEENVTLPLNALHETRLARVSLKALGEGGLRLTKPRVLRNDPVAITREKPTTPPHILLYVADTLRADHLGTYGYEGNVSPRLDGFAAEATVFTRAFAQSSWTKASMASIFTGLTPQRHGANGRASVLASTLVTLPERVEALGYETVGFITNPNLTDAFGFEQGFDAYHFLPEDDRRRGFVRSNVLTDRAIEWLAGREHEKPFFLYLHAMDPHDPYLGRTARGRERHGRFEIGEMDFMSGLEEGRVAPPEDVRSRLMELYAAEIRFNDEHFGRLLDRLRELELYEDMLIVFMSDHGEEFAEHGWWRHGKTLYQEQLHVPMIVKWPKGWAEGRRIDAVVQHVDLVPTVLDYLGASPGPELSGRSVLPIVEGREEPSPAAVTSYLKLDGREVESLILEDMKLIRYLAYDRTMPGTQLFRLGDDPGETRDVHEEEPASREFLSGVLAHFRTVASVPESESADIDAELLEQLRALGYMK